LHENMWLDYFWHGTPFQFEPILEKLANYYEGQQLDHLVAQESEEKALFPQDSSKRSGLLNKFTTLLVALVKEHLLKNGTQHCAPMCTLDDEYHLNVEAAKFGISSSLDVAKHSPRRDIIPANNHETYLPMLCVWLVNGPRRIMARAL